MKKPTAMWAFLCLAFGEQYINPHAVTWAAPLFRVWAPLTSPHHPNGLNHPNEANHRGMISASVHISQNQLISRSA